MIKFITKNHKIRFLAKSLCILLIFLSSNYVWADTLININAQELQQQDGESVPVWPNFTGSLQGAFELPTGIDDAPILTTKYGGINSVYFPYNSTQGAVRSLLQLKDGNTIFDSNKYMLEEPTAVGTSPTKSFTLTAWVFKDGDWGDYDSLLSFSELYSTWDQQAHFALRRAFNTINGTNLHFNFGQVPGGRWVFVAMTYRVNPANPLQGQFQAYWADTSTTDIAANKIENLAGRLLKTVNYEQGFLLGAVKSKAKPAPDGYMYTSLANIAELKLMDTYSDQSAIWNEFNTRKSFYSTAQSTYDASIKNPLIDINFNTASDVNFNSTTKEINYIKNNGTLGGQFKNNTDAATFSSIDKPLLSEAFGTKAINFRRDDGKLATLQLKNSKDEIITPYFNIISYSNHTKPFTVAAWVYKDGLWENTDNYFSFTESGSGFTNNQRALFSIGNKRAFDNSGLVVDFNERPAGGKWIYVVVTYDGFGTLKSYHASYEATSLASNSITNTSLRLMSKNLGQGFILGAVKNMLNAGTFDYRNLFTGQLASLKVYATDFTESELTTQFNAEKSKYATAQQNYITAVAQSDPVVEVDLSNTSSGIVVTDSNNKLTGLKNLGTVGGTFRTKTGEADALFSVDDHGTSAANFLVPGVGTGFAAMQLQNDSGERIWANSFMNNISGYTKPFTLEAWVFKDGNWGFEETIMSFAEMNQGGYGNSARFGIGTNTNYGAFFGQSRDISYGQSPINGKWVYVAVTYNGTNKLTSYIGDVTDNSATDIVKKEVTLAGQLTAKDDFQGMLLGCIVQDDVVTATCWNNSRFSGHLAKLKVYTKEKTLQNIQSSFTEDLQKFKDAQNQYEGRLGASTAVIDIDVSKATQYSDGQEITELVNTGTQGFKFKPKDAGSGPVLSRKYGGLSANFLKPDGTLGVMQLQNDNNERVQANSFMNDITGNTRPFTLEAWVFKDGNWGDTETLLSFGEMGQAQRQSARFNVGWNSTLGAFWSGAGDVSYQQSPVSGKWVYVAVTYNGTDTLRSYLGDVSTDINGDNNINSDDIVTNSSTLISRLVTRDAYQGVLLGCILTDDRADMPCYFYNRFSGHLAKLQVYTREKSEAEIKSSFSTDLSRFQGMQSNYEYAQTRALIDIDLNTANNGSDGADYIATNNEITEWVNRGTLEGSFKPKDPAIKPLVIDAHGTNAIKFTRDNNVLAALQLQNTASEVIGSNNSMIDLAGYTRPFTITGWVFKDGAWGASETYLSFAQVYQANGRGAVAAVGSHDSTGAFVGQNNDVGYNGDPPGGKWVFVAVTYDGMSTLNSYWGDIDDTQDTLNILSSPKVITRLASLDNGQGFVLGSRVDNRSGNLIEAFYGELAKVSVYTEEKALDDSVVNGKTVKGIKSLFQDDLEFFKNAQTAYETGVAEAPPVIDLDLSEATDYTLGNNNTISEWVNTGDAGFKFKAKAGEVSAVYSTDYGTPSANFVSGQNLAVMQLQNDLGERIWANSIMNDVAGNTRPFTIEAWVFKDGNFGDAETILSFGENRQGQRQPARFAAGSNDNAGAFWAYGEEVGYINDPIAGHWVYVAVTYNGIDKLTSYSADVSGDSSSIAVKEKQLLNRLVTRDAFQGFLLGCHMNAPVTTAICEPGARFTGQLASLKVYTREKSLAQIKTSFDTARTARFLDAQQTYEESLKQAVISLDFNDVNNTDATTRAVVADYTADTNNQIQSWVNKGVLGGNFKPHVTDKLPIVSEDYGTKALKFMTATDEFAALQLKNTSDNSAIHANGIMTDNVGKTRPFTVAAWVFKDGNWDSEETYFSFAERNQGVNNTSAQFSLNSNTYVLRSFIGQNNDIDYKSVPSSGKWVFVAVTYNGSDKLTSYWGDIDDTDSSIDIKNINQRLNTPQLRTRDLGQGFLLGAIFNNPTQQAYHGGFRGQLAELKVYTTELNADAINTVFGAGLPYFKEAQAVYLEDLRKALIKIDTDKISVGSNNQVTAWVNQGVIAGEFIPKDSGKFPLLSEKYGIKSVGFKTTAGEPAPLQLKENNIVKNPNDYMLDAANNTKPFTVTAWVFKEAAWNEVETYFSFAERQTANYKTAAFNLGYHNDRGAFEGWGNNIGYLKEPIIPLAKRWLFIAVTYDPIAKIMKSYWADALASSEDFKINTKTGVPLLSSKNISQGFLLGTIVYTANNTYDAPFNGQLAAMKVYTDVLDEGTIKTFFAEQQKKYRLATYNYYAKSTEALIDISFNDMANYTASGTSITAIKNNGTIGGRFVPYSSTGSPTLVDNTGVKAVEFLKYSTINTNMQLKTNSNVKIEPELYFKNPNGTLRPFTTIAWVYKKSNWDNLETYFSYAEYGQNATARLAAYFTVGTRALLTNGFDLPYNLATNVKPATGQWVMVAVTYDGSSNLKSYLYNSETDDLTLNAEPTVISGWIATNELNQGFILGSAINQLGATVYPFTGQLGGLKYFSGELNSEEIKQEYLESRGYYTVSGFDAAFTSALTSTETTFPNNMTKQQIRLSVPEMIISGPNVTRDKATVNSSCEQLSVLFACDNEVVSTTQFVEVKCAGVSSDRPASALSDHGINNTYVVSMPDNTSMNVCGGCQYMKNADGQEFWQPLVNLNKNSSNSIYAKCTMGSVANRPSNREATIINIVRKSADIDPEYKCMSYTGISDYPANQDITLSNYKFYYSTDDNQTQKITLYDKALDTNATSAPANQATTPTITLACANADVDNLNTCFIDPQYNMLRCACVSDDGATCKTTNKFTGLDTTSIYSSDAMTYSTCSDIQAQAIRNYGLKQKSVTGQYDTNCSYLFYDLYNNLYKPNIIKGFEYQAPAAGATSTQYSIEPEHESQHHYCMSTAKVRGLNLRQSEVILTDQQCFFNNIDYAYKTIDGMHDNNRVLAGTGESFRQIADNLLFVDTVNDNLLLNLDGRLLAADIFTAPATGGYIGCKEVKNTSGELGFECIAADIDTSSNNCTQAVKLSFTPPFNCYKDKVDCTSINPAVGSAKTSADCAGMSSQQLFKEYPVKYY